MEWDINFLPPSLRELVDVIGITAAQKLVNEFGGLRLTVPVKMPEQHPLAQLLGLESARKLSHHYAQERLDVPKALSAIQAARNHQMRIDHARGVSTRQLAQREGLTERRVWEILADRPVDDRQADMFDGGL